MKALPLLSKWLDLHVARMTTQKLMVVLSPGGDEKIMSPISAFLLNLKYLDTQIKCIHFMYLNFPKESREVMSLYSILKI